MASVRILHVSHLPLRLDHRAALEEAAGSGDLAVESATPRPEAELIALVQQRQPDYVALVAAPGVDVEAFAAAVGTVVLRPRREPRRDNHGMMQDVFVGYERVGRPSQ